MDEHMVARRVAVNGSFVPYSVRGVDAQRSAIAATDRAQWLRLLDGDTLRLRREWHLGEDAIGTHAVRASDEVALVSGVDTVTLLDPGADPIWTFRHEVPWGHGGFERGCAWFDHAGEPFAVTPREGYDGCDLVHLDRRDGRPLVRVAIDTDPAGSEVIHQPDGWVGISVGEGQDGAFAWWTRLGANGLESFAAEWDDEVLFDVDPAGRHILTTPHSEGPLRVRTFPDLAIVREIAPPPGTWWDFYACFAGEHIVAKTVAEDDVETLVAVDRHSAVTTLASSDRPITPGPGGSWLTNTPEGLERWTLCEKGASERESPALGEAI